MVHIHIFIYHKQTYVQPLCPFAVPNLWGASELNLATASLETVQRALVLSTVERPDMVCSENKPGLSRWIVNKMHDMIHIETMIFSSLLLSLKVFRLTTIL